MQIKLLLKLIFSLTIINDPDFPIRSYVDL